MPRSPGLNIEIWRARSPFRRFETRFGNETFPNAFREVRGRFGATLHLIATHAICMYWLWFSCLVKSGCKGSRSEVS